eukprot:4505580-Pyramimonas_sp.AAC.1
MEFIGAVFVKRTSCSHSMRVGNNPTSSSHSHRATSDFPDPGRPIAQGMAIRATGPARLPPERTCRRRHSGCSPAAGRG